MSWGYLEEEVAFCLVIQLRQVEDALSFCRVGRGVNGVEQCSKNNYCYIVDPAPSPRNPQHQERGGSHCRLIACNSDCACILFVTYLLLFSRCWQAREQMHSSFDI